MSYQEHTELTALCEIITAAYPRLEEIVLRLKKMRRDQRRGLMEGILINGFPWANSPNGMFFDVQLLDMKRISQEILQSLDRFFYYFNLIRKEIAPLSYSGMRGQLISWALREMRDLNTTEEKAIFLGLLLLFNGPLHQPFVTQLPEEATERMWSEHRRELDTIRQHLQNVIFDPFSTPADIAYTLDKLVQPLDTAAKRITVIEYVLNLLLHRNETDESFATLHAIAQEYLEKQRPTDAPASVIPDRPPTFN